MPQIHCPNCGQRYDLTDAQAPQYAGQTISCTACKKPFTVPPNPGAATAAPAAAYAPQPVGYASPSAQPTTTSGLAIASLICGVLGFVVPLIPGLLAIVFGILGIKKTRDPRVGGKGLAIAGISVGAISILLSGCLLSILLPSLNRARETANRVKCASNMRQIGTAILLYANENKGAYPPRLEDLLLTQEITSNVFVCPSTTDTPAPGTTEAAQAAALSSGGHLSYIYVAQHLGDDAFKLVTSASPDTIVLYEAPTDHGGDGMNVLFTDGHVEFLGKASAARVIAELNAGHNPPHLPMGWH